MVMGFYPWSRSEYRKSNVHKALFITAWLFAIPGIFLDVFNSCNANYTVDMEECWYERDLELALKNK